MNCNVKMVCISETGEKPCFSFLLQDFAHGKCFNEVDWLCLAKERSWNVPPQHRAPF